MMRTRVIAFAVALLTSVWVNAATFTVVNTNDSGAGSFRQAILDANLNADQATDLFRNMEAAAGHAKGHTHAG